MVALFLAWVRLADAYEPGAVVLLVSISTLVAMVLSIAGIFVVLIFRPNPRRARHSGLVRPVLATALGCVTGFVLFFVWFGLSYGSGSGVAQVAVTGAVLIALVVTIAGIFSVVVFPLPRSEADADSPPGAAPVP